jgi:hypothetical protein
MLIEPGSLSEGSKCPKCGANTVGRDNEGDLHCWGCGTTFFEKTVGPIDYQLERHRFYEANKTAILADVQSIGANATAKKWKVHGASLFHVLQRWEREAKTASTETAEKEVKEVEAKEASIAEKEVKEVEAKEASIAEKEVKEVEAKEVPQSRYTRRRSHTGINPWTRHVYYETNKEEIIADLFSVGRNATRRKWGLSSGQFFALEKRWLTKEQKEIVDKVAQNLELQTGENGRLPRLPQFSMTWPPEVQLKWLEVYDKLLTMDKEEAKKE